MDIDAEIERLHSSEKSFSQAPSWTYDANKSDKWVTRTPLDIDYVTVEGLFLDGWCFVREPERSVTFTLLYFPPSGLSGPIARIDWRPTHDHSNNGRIDGLWKWRPVIGTHGHNFDLNRHYGWRRMVNDNLPVALPVQEELNDFRALLGYLGRVWNIKGVQAIPVPEWSSELDLR